MVSIVIESPMTAARAEREEQERRRREAEELHQKMLAAQYVPMAISFRWSCNVKSRPPFVQFADGVKRNYTGCARRPSCKKQMISRGSKGDSEILILFDSPLQHSCTFRVAAYVKTKTEVKDWATFQSCSRSIDAASQVDLRFTKLMCTVA
jgi:hypothetical protein